MILARRVMAARVRPKVTGPTITISAYLRSAGRLSVLRTARPYAIQRAELVGTYHR
jgi:hypothetical protein